VSESDRVGSVRRMAAVRDWKAAPPRFWMAVLAAEQSVVVAISMWLQQSSGPILYTDEMGYLGAAVEISNRSATPFLAHMESYSVGYSAILAIPMSILGADPWKLAVVVNVAATIALPILAFNLIRRISTLKGYQAAAVAAAAGAYPAAILHVTRAWPEAILPTLIILWATAVHSGMRRPSAQIYSTIAALASLLYFVHHRTVSVAGATALMMVMIIGIGIQRQETTQARMGLVGLLVLVASFMLGRVLEHHTTTAIYLDHSFDRASYVLDGFRPRGLPWSGRVLLGQVWYLLVATLGLSALAAVRVGRYLSRPGRWRVVGIDGGACVSWHVGGGKCGHWGRLPENNRAKWSC